MTGDESMSVQILQLAELLSMNNTYVMKEMEACVADREKYCEEHRQEYEVLNCLDENELLEEWCTLLNIKWQSSGICLVQLDMDNDAYIILPVYPHFHDCPKKICEKTIMNIRISYLTESVRKSGGRRVIFDLVY